MGLQWALSDATLCFKFLAQWPLSIVLGKGDWAGRDVT
jgi:hypothetical protein